MQKSSFRHRLSYYEAISSTIYSVFSSKIRLFGQAPRERDRRADGDRIGHSRPQTALNPLVASTT